VRWNPPNDILLGSWELKRKFRFRGDARMGDEDGEGAVERYTKEHWEKEKAKLEASKLGIEFRNYERRLELEDKKLESDVKDWYFRAFVAIITTIASVAGFFFGKIYELKRC
jgi:hypothetical protein